MPVAKTEDGLWLTVVDVGLRPREDQILLEGREPFSFHEFGYELTLMPVEGGDTNRAWIGMSLERGFPRTSRAPY